MKIIFDEVDLNRLKYCREILGGLFEIRLDNEKLNLDPVYVDFDTAKQYIQTKHIKDKEAQYKDLYLHRFYLSKRFYDFYTDLINLQTNPFIPKLIKDKIEIIVKHIYFNIGELFKLLTKYISEQQEAHYQVIYSQFELNKIDHKTDLDNLRNTISKYFKVNTN